MPTRLLDWTNNPLAALLFAVEKDSDHDGMLFVADAYRFAPSQKVNESLFRGVATSRNPLFKKALRPIFGWEKPDDFFPEFILPVRPDHLDRRVVLQKACFTFHPPGMATVTKSSNDSLCSFLVPKGAKERIRKELFTFGTDTFSIYGDLEGLSRRLRYAHGLK